MLQLSELLFKIRSRLKDTDRDNYRFPDAELIDTLNNQAMQLCMEFRLNKQSVTEILSKENRSFNIDNLVGIISAHFNHSVISERTDLHKESGETALYINGDTISVTPFQSGLLEVIYYSYQALELEELEQTIDLPRITENALIYGVISQILEIPTSDNNLQELQAYRMLVKGAKDAITNYLNGLYSNQERHYSKNVRV